MINIINFINNRTIEHVADDSQQLMVDCPDIFDKPDDVIIKDKKILESLEDIIMGWERQITRIIEVYQAKVI